jgi:peptide deformylase
MIETMRIAGGAGLAAPQVGYNVRLFVMQFQTDPRAVVCVNPTIVKRADETVMRREGCLSMPDVYFEVPRAAWVDVRFSDLAGSDQVARFTDLHSICAQHEIDHLDGVRAIDHLTPLRRAMALKQFAKRVQLRRRARK